MAELRQIHAQELTSLADKALHGLGCVSGGVVLMQGAHDWGAHERGYIELPTPEGTLVVPLAYDEREAPYTCDESGHEQADFLLSLADEDDYLACFWAQATPDSPLCGVGVDLSAAHHFHERRSGRDLSRLLFTEHELVLADQLEDDPLLAYATLFASKEAAFKATAAPLRRWYDSHDKQLLFEVRHFVMERPGAERGTGRNGAAQHAMDTMGISCIVLDHVCVENMALVVATARRR